jgi:hypothetical protein
MTHIIAAFVMKEKREKSDEKETQPITIHFRHAN